MKRFILLGMICIAFSQSLFENAGQTSKSNLETNGHISSFISIQNLDDTLSFTKGFTRASFQLKTKKDSYASAFADIYLIHHYNTKNSNTYLDLREAYVDILFNSFNFRIGKQILPWGCADMYKPTDNITPKDMRYPYVDQNDMRQANLLMKMSFEHTSGLGMQGIIIPFYSPNLLPISLFNFPENISIQDINLPKPKLNNTGYALKLKTRTLHYDIAVSYLNAFALQPVFVSEYAFSSPTDVSYSIFQKPWRQHVIGLEAKYDINAWAFRFESAYSSPDKSTNLEYMPKKQIQFSLGMDKTSGPLSILFEYNLNIVPNYQEPHVPTNPILLLDYELQGYNDKFLRQNGHFVHHVFFRAAIDLFHETLNIELPIAYNISTEEYLLSAKINWQAVDALNISIGLNEYSGPDNSLFKLLKPLYNGFYFNIKFSF